MGRYGQSRHTPTERWSRDWIILLLFCLFLVVIIAQLINIQVIRGAEYSKLASAAHTANITLTARRGTMYDRNGEVIASNVDATTIYVNPKEVSDPDRLAQVLEDVLGKETGKSKSEFRSLVSQSDLSFAYILRRADVDLAETLRERLEKEGIKGIHYLEDTKRIYPNSSIGSQVIGFVDVDSKGISGLELEYDKLLKGTDGSLVVERGLKDIPITNGEASRTDAIDGIDIVTSLDINLQKKCEESLLSAIEEHEAQGGSVTVMDAATGEIYAACSYAKKTDEEIASDLKTATDNAKAEKAERERSKAQERASNPEVDPQAGQQNPIMRDDVSSGNANNAQTAPNTPAAEEELDIEPIALYKLEVGKLGSITDVYEPGSTFKPFTAAAVLANNPNVGPGSTYTVPYALEVYDSVITDSHDHDTEDMSLTRILSESSNTGITLVSRAVDRADLYNTYNAFGLGNKTGVDFPGDAAGLVEKSEDWDGVQSATVTFGQGLTVTGLQLVRAYAALEQKGIARTPHFLIDVPKNAEQASELTKGLATETKVADPGVCDEVNEMLIEVVTEGTGEAAGIEGFTVTGKTGTAEIASASGGYEENDYIMSFCGWLYGSSSDLVCLVTIDRPVWGKGGGDVAGPVFADVMSFAAERYQIAAEME